MTKSRRLTHRWIPGVLVGLVAAALLAPQLFSAPGSGAGAGAAATPEPSRSLAVETYPLSFATGFVQQRAY